MKKVLSFIIISVLLFCMPLGSFSLSKKETDLLKPYYGYYVVTKGISYPHIATEGYLDLSLAGYIIDKNGLTIVKPSVTVIEKNGQYALEKVIRERFITGVKSVKTGKVANTLVVVFGDEDNFKEGLTVTFKTNNKVQTMSDVFGDIGDYYYGLTKMTIKDDNAYFSAFEKANSQELAPFLKSFLEEEKSRYDKVKYEANQRYKANISNDEACFNKIKTGVRTIFGWLGDDYIIFQDQGIYMEMYVHRYNYDTEEYENTAYKIAEVNRSVTTRPISSENSTEVTETTMTIQLKDGGQVIVKHLINSEKTHYQFIVKNEELGFFPEEDAYFFDFYFNDYYQ